MLNNTFITWALIISYSLLVISTKEHYTSDVVLTLILVYSIYENTYIYMMEFSYEAHKNIKSDTYTSPSRKGLNGRCISFLSAGTECYHQSGRKGVQKTK